MNSLFNTLKLIALLPRNRYMSQSDLADKLDIGERQLRRYLIDMQDAGIQIESKRGRYGGVRLSGGDFLTDAVKSMIEGIETDELMSKTTNLHSDHIELLKAIVTGKSNKEFKRLGSQIDEIMTAISDKRTMQITYKKRAGDIVKRKVAPFLLREEFGRYYLLGFDYEREVLRKYRLDRIKLYNVLTVKHNFIQKEIDKMLLDEGKKFINDGKQLEVVMLVDMCAYNHIKEDFSGLKFGSRIKEGSRYKVSALISNVYMLKRAVLKEGANIQVIFPQYLVDEIYDELSRTLKNYQNHKEATL